MHATEDEGSSSFKLTRSTYRKHLWNALYYLELFMSEIDIDNRCVFILSFFASYSLPILSSIILSISQSVDISIQCLMVRLLVTLRSSWMEPIVRLIVLELEKSEICSQMEEIKKIKKIFLAGMS